MPHVFYLRHRIDYGPRSHRKGIGVYRTVDGAVSAMRRLGSKPGFSDPRGEFTIYRCEIDHNYWPSAVDAATNLVKPGDVQDAEIISVDHVVSAYLDNDATDDDSITFGYFSSPDLAQSAIAAAMAQIPSQPPWVYGKGYTPLDRDGWVDGFVIGD